MTFKKGNEPWNKGKQWEEEMRRKISEGRKGKMQGGNQASFKKGDKPLHAGKKAEWAKGKKNTNWGKFGKNHPCYKETKRHKFLKLIRETFKYRQWRSDIFTRDDFTCVFCGERGVELNADHFPKRFIDIINEYKIKTLDDAIFCEELWNINNGRTLCIECHKKTDTWGNRPYKISSN